MVSWSELTKRQIRSKILLRLKTQEEEERGKKSRKIAKKLLRSRLFKRAKTVMFYIAFGGEVDTKEMIKRARILGKIIAVPVCVRGKANMMPCLFDTHASLKKGPYGVLEPAEKKYIPLDDLDLVIVPAVAFDKKGNRLGRGKGCYDRFLKKLPPEVFSLGLGFNFQILPAIPTKPHDINVQKIFFA